MSQIKAVRTPTGAWVGIDGMTETELRAYVANLANELTTGVQVLEALIAYGRCRWPDGEEWADAKLTARCPPAPAVRRRTSPGRPR